MNIALIVILAFLGFGLALIAVSMWLLYRGKPVWFTVLPVIFMMATTIYALYKLLVTRYLPTGNMPLVFTDICLMVLAICVIILSVKKYIEIKASPPNIAPGN